MWDFIKRKKWVISLIAAIAVIGVLGLRFDVVPKNTNPIIGQGTVVIKIGTAEASGTVDYTCDGTDDNIQFQGALDALPATGGEIQVLTGNYDFANGTTVTRAIDNVTIIGVGRGSYFTCDTVTPIFTAGGNNWTISNLRTDAGSLAMGATTGWSWENVTINATYYAYRTDDATTGASWNIPTGRSATYTIAASNATASVKAQADVVCDGTADNVEIQAYINALSAGRTIQEEVLCVGTFNIAASITLPSYTILEIQGEIGYSGSVNDAVIVIDPAAVMAEIDGGIIRGGGKGNANANGVELIIPNGGGIFGTTFYDCRNAIDVTGAWQFAIDHVDIHGQGADQNYIGIYTHVPAGNDTALIVSNTSIKDTSSDGIRLEHISGSKWTNVEVGAAGGHGWNIGTPASPKLIQFAHITNCLSDSNIGDAWHIDGSGSGDVAHDIQFSNIWAGNSARAVYIKNGGNITFSNVMFATFTQHAVYVDTGCFRIDFDGGYVDGWGTSAANTYSAFYLDTLAKSFVKNINMTAANSHSSIREVNACNYNQFIGNEIGDAGTIIKVGASTIVSGNRGFTVNSSTTNGYVVASSDATSAEKESANVVCDGTADEVEILAGQTIAAGGTVILVGHTFYISAAGMTINNCTLDGQVAGNYAGTKGVSLVCAGIITIDTLDRNGGLSGRLHNLAIRNSATCYSPLLLAPTIPMSFVPLVFDNLFLIDTQAQHSGSIGLYIDIVPGAGDHAAVGFCTFGSIQFNGFDIPCKLLVGGTASKSGWFNGNKFELLSIYQNGQTTAMQIIVTNAYGAIGEIAENEINIETENDGAYTYDVDIHGVGLPQYTHNNIINNVYVEGVGKYRTNGRNNEWHIPNDSASITDTSDTDTWISLTGTTINARPSTPLTIASGAITVTAFQNIYTVEGEGGASDNLDTISGGNEGQEITLRCYNAAHVITLRDGWDNILTGGNKVLDSVWDIIKLKKVGTHWICLSFNSNA